MHAMQKILYLKQEELSHKNLEQKSKGLTFKLFTRIKFHPQTQFALLFSNGYKSLSKQMNQLHFSPHSHLYLVVLNVEGASVEMQQQYYRNGLCTKYSIWRVARVWFACCRTIFVTTETYSKIYQ